jgi:Tfp pilus assembly protein PilP
VNKQRKLILVIALLVLANIVRWYIASRPVEEATYRSELIAPAELMVNSSLAEAEGIQAMHRDLFKIRIRQREQIAKPVMKKVKPLAAPQKTPQQLEFETAQNELSRIKLLGVVVRKGKTQAYISKGTDTYLVYAGDMFANRYKVERVTLELVEIFDEKVNIRQSIALSGK